MKKLRARSLVCTPLLLTLSMLLSACGGSDNNSDSGTTSGGSAGGGTTGGTTGGGTTSGGTTGGTGGVSSATPFNGTYSANSARAFVSLFEGGQYIIGFDDSTIGCTKNNGAGVEAGTYTWTPSSGNASKGMITFSKAQVDTVDVSGGTGADTDCGLAGDTEDAAINSDGSLSLTATDGTYPITLTPIDPTATSSALGGFVAGQTSTAPSGTALQIGNSTGANSVFIFIDSSHYFLSVTDPDGPGIEDGCYTVSGSSYTFNASSSCVVSASSGATGIDSSGSNTGINGATVNVTVKDANTLSLTDSGDSNILATLTRIPFAN